MKKFLVVFIFLAILVSCSASSSQEPTIKKDLPIRKAAVAGGFYPSDREELRQRVDHFLNNVKKQGLGGRLLALIVPHAGYDYSGQVAAYGFIQLKDERFKTAIIIAPSHYVGFDGVSVYNKGYFQTPLGLVKINETLAEKFIKKGDKFFFYPEAHKMEHAIEVELPFLQRVLGDIEIVPCVIGSHSYEDAKLLSDTLYELMDEDTVLIVSVDLSHYHSYDEAVQLDTSGLLAMERLDADWFMEMLKNGKTEIDAPAAVLATILLGKKSGAKAKLLKYANSGDVTGQKGRVVGYSSLAIYIPSEEEEMGKEERDSLSGKDRKKLLEIARKSIEGYVRNKTVPSFTVTESSLLQPSGAFVTIKEFGELRGCIGYIEAVKPLYQTVQEVAVSAAVNDYRFMPLSEKELKDIELEISVLTPLKKISAVNEIEVGKHGLVIRKGLNSGLLLPQVATEWGWDHQTFLEETCHKAGLPKDAWKDKSTQIYIFSAEVFGEKDF